MGMRIQPIQFDVARKLEWLETNGLGGFASSTVIGMNTRRYHGLLTAATKPPVGRALLLAKLEETLVIGDERFDLGTNQYPGVIHPAGYRYLSEFRLDPFPVFHYHAGGVEIEKRVFLVQGENTVVVEYEQLAGPACEMEVRPLVAFRDYHATTHRNDALNATVQQDKGMLSLQPYPDLPRLYFANDAVRVETTGEWFKNFEYEMERQRGLDFQEDLFQPFLLRYAMKPGGRAAVIASTVPHAAADAMQLKNAELQRREALRASAPRQEALIEQLTLAADQFIVQRGKLQTIIAGYHWFGDWGRDTMIALPGLTLATGRFDVARNILRAFAGCVNQGMLPNRFPDSGEPAEYNTADATLWLFEAARAYAAYSGDFEFVRRELVPVFDDILDWHVKGTRYGIRCDDDGLLACGEAGVQLTWMDAKVGDWVVTPRTGKPVEIEALWYNALRVMEDFCVRAGDSARAEQWASMAGRARASFAEKFWNAEAGCLYDVVMQGSRRDGSLRPNQLFAVSMHYPIVEGERARQVVAAVQRELLTPIGLRTLSPHDPRYRGHYEGDVVARDSAYHQGTVWPWLMGPFLTAYCRTQPDQEAAKQQARLWLNEFGQHLSEACLGQISEIADGELPHAPRGCVAQAWSVAELLRTALEDVYTATP